METETEIEMLKTENAKMKELLQWIGYPKRGTVEADMDIYEAAQLIQDNFTREQLGLDA